MPPETIECPRCALPVPYHKAACANGHFVGYPNVRIAESMKTELNQHYHRGVTGAIAAGLQSELAKLEAILEASVITITVEPKILRNLSYGQPYLSYYKALAEGVRQIALRKHHADRLAADSKIHTGYHAEILNAALSPDLSGLIAYASITVVVKPDSVQDQISLLRENAYDFYNRFGLGDLGSDEQPGWRAIWQDRRLLGVAKLASDLISGATDDQLMRSVLTSGATRKDDRYLEIHIYGTLTWQSIDAIRLDRALATQLERDDWETARLKLQGRGVVILAGASS